MMAAIWAQAVCYIQASLFQCSRYRLPDCHLEGVSLHCRRHLQQGPGHRSAACQPGERHRCLRSLPALCKHLITGCTLHGHSFWDGVPGPTKILSIDGQHHDDSASPG